MSNAKNRNLSKIQILIIATMLVIIGVLTAFVIKQYSEKRVTRTIMLYVVGSNLESTQGVVSVDLESIDTSKFDFDNMNLIMYTGGTSQWQNYISNEENAIYELTKNGFVKKEVYPKNNMGDPETLKTLLDYGYNNYHTDEYDLILYDHGGATYGAIYDDFTKDLLSLEDFQDALSDSPFNSENKLETVLFRTCLNGTLEVAYTFKDYADYLVASEEISFGTNRASVLNFLNEIGSKDSAIDYGKKYISSYETQMKSIDKNFLYSVTYSIVDLKEIDNIYNELDDFMQSFNINDNYSKIARLRSNMYQFGYTGYDNKDYDTVDLYTLVNTLDDYTNKDGSGVLNAIKKAVIYNWSNINEANGISIYFPYRSSQNYQKYYLESYSNISNSKSYYEFINQFNKAKKSGYASSYSTFSLKEGNINNREFTLELNDYQLNDYAYSEYIVFKKEEDEMYTPIFFSDDTKLENNKIITNISNKLIKAYDFNIPNDSGEYLKIKETTIDGKKIISTAGVVDYFGNGGFSTWFSASVKIYFDYDENSNPYVSHMIEISQNDSSTNSTVLYLEDFENIDFSRSSYKIFDENGNYTDNWDNNGIVTLIELDPKKMELKNASLEEDDYYCVFKVYDIYGNYYYSKLMKLNN